MSEFFINHASEQYKRDCPDEPDSLLEEAYESRQGSDLDPYGEEADEDTVQARRAAWLAELGGGEP